MRLKQVGRNTEAEAGKAFHPLRLELGTNWLSVYLNGELMTTAAVFAPGGQAGVLAQGGAIDVDDVRIGATGARPGRIAPARMTRRLPQQAGNAAQRLAVSAVAGDGVTALPFLASSNDPAVASASVEHGTLLVRAAPVTIRIANGRCEELLYLRAKDRVTLRGERRDGVVIHATNHDGINPDSGLALAALSPSATGGRSVLLLEDADLLTLDTLTIQNTSLRATRLPAQAEALYFNSDLHRETYEDNVEPIANEVVYKVSGTPNTYPRGARNIAGLYGELDAPVTKELDLTAVVRIDRFSDFGSTINPKLSVRWQPHRVVMVRGTGTVNQLRTSASSPMPCM